MNWTIPTEMPLLAKELVEQAAQRRTYIIRFVYALLLFGVTCTLLYGIISQGNVSGSTSLGQGKVIFDRLFTLQFWGICIFLPGMASGLIAGEKERDTLVLLLVSTLSPWQITLQKFASRLIPILTFLLLSFPLMAVAYSYGGVNQPYLWSGIVLLVLTAAQIGALSTMCSAFCRTTAEALVASYVLFFLLYNIFPWAFAPRLVDDPASASLQSLLGWSIPNVLTTVAFLYFARIFLIRRAAVTPKNFLLQIFRWLDEVYMQANQVTGGIMLARDIDLLPADNPIAWRETNKKSLGTVRYLFRICVVLETPVLFVITILSGTPRTADAPMSMLLYALWCIAIALVVVHAGSVIPSERSRQTLGVLLTLPLSGKEIIFQKLAGVRRLIIVLMLPFVSIFAFEHWWGREDPDLYLAFSVLSVLIYLPLAAWLTLWISFHARSQIRTILGTFGLLLGWTVGSQLVRQLLATNFGITLDGPAGFLSVLNPALVIPAIQSLTPQDIGIPEPAWAYWTIDFILYGLLLIWLRSNCLRNADRYLGRLPEGSLTSLSEDD